MEFRIGTVVNTNPENCTCRVQFEEIDNFISGDLMILQNKTLNDKSYFMYDIGEMVACILTENSGVVLGAVYNKQDIPNAITGQNKSGIKYEDGTIFEYDKDGGLAKADIVSSLEVTTPDLKINAETKTKIETGQCIVDSEDIQLGGTTGVLHENSIMPCPMWGVIHQLIPSETTKTGE